jgi:8-oxo-dGTP diphosphatase
MLLLKPVTSRLGDAKNICYHACMSLKKPKLANARLAADIVAFAVEQDDLMVLLIHRPSKPFAGSWALPGGFIWDGESTKQAAMRVLKDKGGVENVYIEQLYTFDEPDRDPRGQIVTVSYFAMAPRDQFLVRSSSTTQDPTFYPVNQLPPLAFDHREIIRYAYSRLKAKLEYTNVVYSLLPKRFTFVQLQHTYEVILGEALDRRNFRKKYMSLNLIKPTGELVSGQRHRPAELFEFISRQPSELKRWF